MRTRAVPRIAVRTASAEVSHTWYGSCMPNSGGIVTMRTAAVTANARMAPGNNRVGSWLRAAPWNQLGMPMMPSMDLRQALGSRCQVDRTMAGAVAFGAGACA